MDNVEHDAMSPDPLQAWQQALAEVPQTAALVGAQRGDLFGRFVEWYGRLRRRPRAERRRLQRRLGMSLAGVALLLAVNGAAIGIASPTATIVVDGTTCTLVDAITAANTDTATGGCTAGSGADTINLQTNVTLTAVHNTTQGNNGLPVVTSAITIEGNGNTISRAGGSPDFRIMFVGSGGNLTLNSATISGGVASGTFPSNRGGGAYFGSGSSVIVSNSTFSGNSAFSGGGIDARYVTVTVANSTLSGNSVSRAGGGIEVNFGRTMITNSTLSDNSAGLYGGGILAFAGTVTVANSTISGNRTPTTGGGIRGDSTKMTVQNSTLSGNSAGFGGGMAFRSATAVVQNSTVSGNSASIGGGIGGDFSTVTVQNSIVAAQSAGYDCGIFSGTIPSAGYNIESGTSCGFAGTGDQQNVSGGSLALGALGNNGGPTQTMALGPGSVAIDQIPVSVNGCVVGVSTDQRGAPRAGGAGNGGPACDVGAYEYASTPLAVTLASFAAQANVDHVLLTWETVSELNNSGFNLYRSTSPAAPDELLAFVPSQAPGSTVGASYSFDDDQVAPGQTWHYWLEDIDLNGATTLHGPVSATLQAPTAVTLDALDAQAASPAGGLSAWSALLAAVIGMAGALAARRRSGFR